MSITKYVLCIRDFEWSSSIISFVGFCSYIVSFVIAKILKTKKEFQKVADALADVGRQ